MNLTSTYISRNFLNWGWSACLAIGLMLLAFNGSSAQNPANGIEASGLIIPENPRIVVVEPDDYPLEVGNLNRAIEEEIDDNTIFVLRRDGVYWTDAFIENADHRLHVRAEDGDGHPPVIRSAVDLGQSTYNFRGVRDVIFEGIYFIGINENGVPERTFRYAGENATFVFDDGYITGTFDVVMWMDNVNNRIYFTNSIVTNLGRNGNDQQGRLLDTNGNSQELIYIENNTLYNLGHAFVRNSVIVDHMHLNHNTLMNMSQYIRVGEVQNMFITNSLFTNVYTIGEDEDELERAFVEIRQQQQDNDLRNLVFRNNNVSIDDEFLDLIAERDEHNPDVVISRAPNVSRQFMDPENELPLVDYENIIDERVTFADEPTLSRYLDWTLHWMTFRGGHTGESPIDNYDHPVMYDRWEDASSDPAPAHFTIDLIRDFTYSSDHMSYTAAENGFPLGDLNWFPDQKAAWIAGSEPVNIYEDESTVKTFRLIGNYPNPFNPTTKIVYELASQVDVKLEVFNILGQKVNSMALGIQGTGRHEVTFNADNLSSGIYMVRMQMGNEVQSILMTLVK